MKDKKKILKISYVVIAILVTIIVLGKVILKYNFTGTHDGYLHLIKIIGVSDIFKTGQFPPIIQSGFCNGYAINLFYNPVTTYISLIFGSILNNYIIGIRLMLIIMMILAGIFMYLFLKEVTGRKDIGLIAAIFYIIAPYYLSNIYVRGAIGEAAALTFLPLLFLGLYNLFNDNGDTHYIIAIAASGLLLTHNITTLYAAIFSIIYVLVNIFKLKEKAIIKKLLVNVAFIIGITLFFIYPLGLHRISGDYVVFNTELMRTNGERVAENTLELSQLFTEIDNQEIIFKFNIVQFILFIPFVYFHKYVEEKNKKIYFLFSILAIITSAIVLIKEIWLKAPDILCTIQFPWRLLGFVNMFMSVISAINLSILVEKILKVEKSSSIFIFILIAMIALFVSYTCNYKFNASGKNDKESIEFIENNIDSIEYSYINREYLPSKTYKNLKTNPERINMKKAVIISGDANIIAEEKQELTYKIEIEDVEKDTNIEIPFLYYIGYNAYLEKEDGEKVEIEIQESEYGFVEVKLKNEYSKGKLIVEYKTPVSYYICYIVSGISLIGLIIYVIIYKRKITNRE